MTGIVLDKLPFKEQDVTCVLYTEELGRIRATAHGGRKITSKLSAHLEPLNVSQIRLVGGVLTEGGGLRFSIADALTLYRLDAGFFPLINMVARMTPWQEPDPDLWQLLIAGGPLPSGRQLLSVLGFDPQNARCELCGQSGVTYFIFDGFFYTCAACPPPIASPADYFEFTA